MQDKKQLQQSGVTRVEKGLAQGGDGLAIDFGGKLYLVGPRPFSVGRATTGDLVLDHPTVSRYHARIVRTKAGYEVEDLQSRNGVAVDSQPVNGSAAIYPGAVITFGEVSALVRSARRASEAVAQTEPDLGGRQPRQDDTGPVNALLLFMTSVDQALIKGEIREAEREFALHLALAAERAAQRGRLDAGIAQTVGLLSLRLGEATANSVWLDFVVRLYSAMGSVVPLTVVNAMQALARKLGGVDRSALRQYAARLAERGGELTPEEHCILDRLQALATSEFVVRSRAVG